MNSGGFAGWKFVFLAGVVGGLSGCGGSDDKAPVAAGVPAADLSTPAGVKATVANLTSAFTAIDAITGIANPAPVVLAADGAYAKAAEPCAHGGTQDFTIEQSTDATSPFTDEAFELDVATLDNCVVAQYADDDNSDNVTGFGDVTVTGRNAFGAFTDTAGNLIDHIEMGTTAAPLNYFVETSTTTGGNTVNVGFDLDMFMREDFIERTDGTEEGRTVADFTGAYSTHGVSISFDAFIGSTENPFTFELVAPQTLLLNGSFGFSSSVPQGAGCANGTTTIATDEADPLVEVEGVPFEFSSGTIQLASGGKEATVVFNDDGTMTITPDGGSPETVDQSEVRDLGASCASLLQAGLGLAESFPTQ